MKREVAVGLGHGRGEPQDDRVAALHVAAAEAVQERPVEPCGQVVVDRHGVDVAGDHDALAATQLGARHQRVAVPAHLEVSEPAQGRLDLVGDRPLVEADGLDVDELTGQRDHVGGQIEHHAP